MICEFGDVVVVPFPFVDLVAEKRRPSLILSHETFNASHRHSIFVMITTAARSNWPSDVTIEDLKSAGLAHPCVVRWKVFTLPNDFIIRRAGKLSARDRNTMVSAARGILA